MTSGEGLNQGPTNKEGPPDKAGDTPDPGEKTESRTPAPTGWATHLERLTAAKKEHRRKMATRLWYAAIPVVLAVILAMALLSVYGGFGGDRPVATTTTVPVLRPTEGSGLLLVEDESALLMVAAIQPRDKGGVVLAIPGVTLLESAGGLRTLVDLYDSGGIVAVERAILEAFDAVFGAAAVVGWSDLNSAMSTAGVQRTSIEPTADEGGAVDEGAAAGEGTPVLEGSELEGLAQELRYFMAAAITDLGSNLWYDLEMRGNAAGFVEAVVLDASSMAVNEWTVSSLEGSLVRGEDFVYLEPDIDRAGTLLGAVSREEAVTSVEVKDGAGVGGAPESAGDLLESAGYSLLPMGYAEAFPEVEVTQIMVPPSGREEAQRVRDLLGVGDVVEDATLEADHVVVILGKDFGQELPAEDGAVE